MPVWFENKVNKNFTEALFMFTEPLKRLVIGWITWKKLSIPWSTKRFSLHHENVLLAMIFNKRPGLRRLLWRTCFCNGEIIKHFDSNTHLCKMTHNFNFFVTFNQISLKLAAQCLHYCEKKKRVHIGISEKVNQYLFVLLWYIYWMIFILHSLKKKKNVI